MTVESFRRNIEPLSRRYHVVAYDPRSQGQSSKCQSGNDYTRHGQDLANLIDKLALKKPVLAGWSTGVMTCYAYFEQFGCENIRAFVSIDMSPKPIQADVSDWGSGTRAFVRHIQASITNPDQTAVMREFASKMYLMGEADARFVNGIVSQSLNTPPSVAALLLADGNLCDYTDIAKQVAARLPVLQIVSERVSERATNWIKANTPKAELHVLGAHMMFWEYPGRFNEVIAEFVGRHSG